MSRTEKREYMVGLAAAIVFAAIFAMSVTANRRNAEGGANGFRLSAEFARVDGIHVGSQVRLAGMPIGTVTAMELNSRFRPLLMLHFTREVPLPDDTSAAIQTDGLFGTKFIEVQPGGSDTLLKSGDRIVYAQESVILEDLVAGIVTRAQAARNKAGAPATAPESNAP